MSAKLAPPTKLLRSQSSLSKMPRLSRSTSAPFCCKLPLCFTNARRICYKIRAFQRNYRGGNRELEAS